MSKDRKYANNGSFDSPQSLSTPEGAGDLYLNRTAINLTDTSRECRYPIGRGRHIEFLDFDRSELLDNDDLTVFAQRGAANIRDSMRRNRVTVADDIAGEIMLVTVVGFDMYIQILQELNSDYRLTYGDTLYSVLSLETYADHFEQLAISAPSAVLIVSAADGREFALGELKTGEPASETSVLSKGTVIIHQ